MYFTQIFDIGPHSSKRKTEIIFAVSDLNNMYCMYYDVQYHTGIPVDTDFCLDNK